MVKDKCENKYKMQIIYCRLTSRHCRNKNCLTCPINKAYIRDGKID